MVKPLDPVALARQVQLEASAPGRSVVLGAAAGSGKTTALVNRFLRLCLEDTPARAGAGTVLAVTFTRKAAVEIQERLLHQARALALAAPAERAQRLAALFGPRDGRAPDQVEIAAAGALYEQLLADTAALQLGTIHSFCQVVLGRFAREAGLDPTFGVLEEPQDLHDEAFDRLVGEIAREPLLAAAARRLGAHPDGLRRLLQPCLDQAMRLERWLAADGARPRPRAGEVDRLAADLRRHLLPTVAADDDGDGDARAKLGALLAAALQRFARGLVPAASARFDDFPGKSRGTLDDLVAGAEALAAGYAAGIPDAEAALALAAGTRALLLTQQGKVKSFSKSRDPEFKPAFNALVAAQALPALAIVLDLERVELLEDNVALLRLGLRLLDIVDELKRRDRVVDFQDLEDLASGLLADPDLAGELQYRLDDAIQHILVDEFQDTNLNQWGLLRPFVEEFRAGGGERPRTVFLVGDVKQSIYGFRGAWPQLFADIAADMARYDCSVLELPTNFRSLRAIVEGVGEVFNAPPLSQQLEPGQLAGVRQAFARMDGPGSFVVHAPFPDPDDPDRPGGGGGEARAARAAAALVRRLHDEGVAVFDPALQACRPLAWRDVLVLARTRTAFALYERAFRDAAVPFAPPGRGMLAASREVQDLLALLRWLAWPDDDEALATVLRSPIFRFGEASFQALLSLRGINERREDGRWRDARRSLWQALRESTDPLAIAAAATLAGWRRRLDFEPCHDLLRRVARDADLPARYQVALGEQARFNLERLFDLALAGDVPGTPTARRLADAIARAAARGNQEEASLPGDGEGRVRFLTVHGAKGLEAPVVLLVDADRGPGRARPQVVLGPEDGHPALLLRTSAAQRAGLEFPEGVTPPTDPLATAVARAQARDEAERAHLLYVALTRARDHLHVLGGDRSRAGGDGPDSPLRALREAASAVAIRAAADGLDVSVTAPDAADDELHDLPDEVRAPGARAPHEPPPPAETWQPPTRRPRFTLVRPSAAADDERPEPAELGLDDDAGARPTRERSDLPAGVEPAAHGDLVHRLLQAACNGGVLPSGEGLAYDEAAAVLADPELAWVFGVPTGGAAASEVPVVGRRAAAKPAPAGGPPASEQRITGVIDRLVVRADRVDIIDYKTNRGAAVPAQRAWLTAHYRPQLQAYREVLVQLYPDRPVRTWLLFTDPAVPAGARLHEVE
ncbi:MAG: UvrD-helicase domain-containing protein [bacterium]|nr:UvrD-helicase domain-containing protein [bacterium]